MPITAECPSCGFKGNVPDQFKGKKVKCRKCANPFLVGGPAPAPSKNGSAERKSNPDLVEMEVVEEKSPPVRRARPTEQGFVLPDPEPGSPFSNLDEPEAPAPRKAKASAQGTRPAKTSGSAQGIKPAKSNGSAQGTRPKPKDSSPLLDLDEAPTRKKGGKRSFKKKDMEPASIVVVVLGVMALILSGGALGVGSLGQIVALISVPLSGLGLLLSIGGVVMAWGRPGLRILVPGLATLLSLVALPVAGWFSFKAIDSGVLNSKEETQAQATNPAAPPPVTTQPSKQGGAVETKPNSNPMPPATQPKKDPPPPLENYVDALREKAQVGAMRIQVTKVDIDAKAKRMLVHISMENTSKDQFIEYLGWGSLDREPAPILKDNLPPPQTGTYKRLLPAPGETIPNQIDPTYTFKPGDSKVDVIAFEVPSDKVLFLHLDLPAANLDDGKVKGAFKFKIPRSMLLGSGPLDPNPKDPVKDPKDPPKDPRKEAPKDPMFVAKRVVILTDPKMRVPQKIAALRELAEIGEYAEGAAPTIAVILGNKMMDEQLRAQAAETLGEIGPKAGTQVEALRRALREDTFHVVKAKAARSLGQMGKVASAAIPDLEALLMSKDEGVPEEAKRAINRIKNAK